MRREVPSFDVPSVEELRRAHDLFQKNEPRDLFYRAATELVSLAEDGKTSLSLEEALAVLLQTWNRPFYQYRRFSEQHFTEIRGVLSKHRSAIGNLRHRRIETLVSEDEGTVKDIFSDFEAVLGPVGAAKALHLLAPHFFPLWDRAIAEHYRVGMKRWGENADGYGRFMGIAKEQCLRLGGQIASRGNPLKALDEFNYCNYTKRGKWM